MPIDLTRYTLFADQSIEEFRLLDTQGYCNDNYIAKTVDQSYLIRFLKLQNLDRRFEFKAQYQAYTKKLAPKPLILDLEHNIMVTNYSQGEHLFSLSKKELRKLALSLRKLHKIKLRKKPHNHKKDFKLRHKKANATLLKLKKHQRDLVLTHHDLNPKNIFFTDKVTIVDWEFAGINDRYFDLATVCVEFKLNRKMEHYFLQQYFHRHSLLGKWKQEKLKLYKDLYQELYHAWMDENTDQAH